MAQIAIILMSCLGAAVASWLAPASIQIVNWTGAGPVRVALFAPLFGLWAALAVGAVLAAAVVLAGSHARAKRAERAVVLAPVCLLWLWTVPYWPWLPERAPALLILAGPARWLVAGAALVGVVAAWPREQDWGGSLLRQFNRRRVFALTLALYVALGLRSLAALGLGGDEPHYLIITHSLLVDRDLKIENNHTNGDYRSFFGGPLRPDFLHRGQNGEIYSVHSPGLSVLLLPGYAVAGARGAVVTMCLLGALAALAVYDVAWLLGGGAAAFLTWVSVCLTVPFLPHAWMLYPETAGAAIVAWAVLWLVAPLPERPWAWIARGACLGALPWLHTKFVVFLAILGLFLFWRLRKRFSDLSALALPIAVSSAAWFSFFYVVYGSLDPQAPYGDYTQQFVRFVNVPRSLLGILVDQKFGLLVYGPIYLCAAAGFWLLLREVRWRALTLALLATAVPYLLSSSRLYMWWGGSSAPARFLVPVLPLLAPAVAAAWIHLRGRVPRAAMGVWLAISVLVAAAGTGLPERRLLFSTPHGIARALEVAQGSAPVSAGLPTFTEEDWTSPLGRSVPWALAAAVALGLAAVVAARARQVTVFWTAMFEAVAFVVAGSVLTAPSAAPVRAESALRGRLGLMDAYDPNRLRGFDYQAGAALDPVGLLRVSTLTFERPQAEAPDEQGRIAGPIGVPQGRYEARVWFRGGASHDGDLLLLPRRGTPLARLPGPLQNPAVLSFDMPAPTPFWFALTEPSSARAADRVEIEPVSIVAQSRRFRDPVRAVEAIEGRPNAYVVYVNEETYPEGGVFWTRAGNRGRVLVATAGSSQMVLTLHVGPNGGTVKLTVAGQNLDTEMQPNETRDVTATVPADGELVAVTVQAPGWFQPASVDRQSTDTRALGCQVRIGLR